MEIERIAGLRTRAVAVVRQAAPRTVRARPRRPSADQAEELHEFHERALRRGVNPFVYGPLRVAFAVFFRLYFRLERIGRQHLPASGPLILASNHRSFLDPFVIGTLVRRPVYYVAKEELFNRRWQAWVLNSLGAFPVRRGASDRDTMATASAILARGDCVVIFPEGTRVRPGPLGSPHRGIGRLALETGASVVAVAVFGTEAVRRGWRIRPHKVRLRCGRPLQFPTAGHPSRQAATMVTERVWACVNLQWEWLGGAPASRHLPETAADDTPSSRMSGAV